MSEEILRLFKTSVIPERLSSTYHRNNKLSKNNPALFEDSNINYTLTLLQMFVSSAFGSAYFSKFAYSFLLGKNKA